MRVFLKLQAYTQSRHYCDQVLIATTLPGGLCSNKNRTACRMAKPQSTGRGHLARPLNVMLAGCCLEGSPLGQVTPAAF